MAVKRRPSRRSTNGPPSKRAAKETTDAVAERLRALYDETVNEPVPQELSDLIKELIDEEAAGDGEDD